jgi:hypothetical protein
MVQDRQEKRSRLAAARNGTGEYVAPRQCRRDSIGLNRGRAREAELFEAFEKVRMKL